MSTIGTSLSSIFNSLTSSGVSSTVAGSVLSALSSTYKLKSALNNLVVQAVADRAYPDVLAKVVMNIETTQGVPPAILDLAGTLPSKASDVGAYMLVIQEIETAIGQI